MKHVCPYGYSLGRDFQIHSDCEICDDESYSECEARSFKANLPAKKPKAKQQRRQIEEDVY